MAPNALKPWDALHEVILDILLTMDFLSWSHEGQTRPSKMATACTRLRGSPPSHADECIVHHWVGEGATTPCVNVIGIDSVAAAPVFRQPSISAEEGDVGSEVDWLDDGIPCWLEPLSISSRSAPRPGSGNVFPLGTRP